MIIKLRNLFPGKKCDDIIAASEIIDIDVDSMIGCDVIALVHTGRSIIGAYPACFTRSAEDEIIIDDSRTLKEKYWNKVRVNHIHTFKGVKFTCVTLNLPGDKNLLGTKYYHQDTWIDRK